MNWIYIIDIIQFFLIAVVFLMWLITRIPPCPHNIRDLELNANQLQKLWNHLYIYTVVHKNGHYFIRRSHSIDAGEDQLSSSYLTQAEAEAWMKYPARITGWRDDR